MAYSMIVGTHCAFAEHSDRFDRLLTQEDPTIVITVNYDTLVEEALQRRARRYCAPLILDDGKLQPSSLDLGSVISLFKLHGSVSWLSMHEGGAGSDFGVALREAEHKQTLSVAEAPFGRVPQTFSTKVFHDRSSLLGALDPRASRVEAPVLAVYGHGKHLLNNPHHIQAHRDECLRRLRDPSSPIDRVVAVGIRFPPLEDDEVLREVVDELGKRGTEKYYVSPSTSDCDAFQKLGFSTKAPTLTEFLNCEKRPSSA